MVLAAVLPPLLFGMAPAFQATRANVMQAAGAKSRLTLPGTVVQYAGHRTGHRMRPAPDLRCRATSGQ